MAKRIGGARALWIGLVGAAAIAGGLAACGDAASSPSTPALGSAGDGNTGQAGAAPDTSTPAPPPEGRSGADAGVSSEGRPPISGINPGPLPSLSSCTPGEQAPCLRDLLCQGVATCNDQGTGLGECVCDATPALGVGVVGARCQADDDCALGGTCMRADGNDYLGAGGPAGGYCTFPCLATSDCEARDPESRCVPSGPDGAMYCIRTCLSKEAEPGEAKCLNRPDLACVSIAADGVVGISPERQEGYCAPRCGSDEDCPLGRFCHRQGGICTDGAAPGAPTGTSCTLTTQCDGRSCEDRIDSVGTCTALCVLGSLSGCGYATEAAQRKVACLTPLVSAGRFSEGPGDLGLCRELCDVDGDCLRAADGFVCRTLNPELAEFTGRTGACVRTAD